MDLNKLRTFYVLAQVKSYSRCARRLLVTQSAVSHAIRNLEESLGLVLIQKKRNAFALTDEGEILFKSCRKIFSEVDLARDTLLRSRDYPEQIRMGCTVEFGVSVLMKGLQGFFETYPNIHIDFDLSHDLLKPLLDDELDLIIDCKPHIRPELKIVPLFQEEYAVIATPRYIETHGIRDIEDLGRCNLLSMDRELVWWSNFINALPMDHQMAVNRVTRINHIRGIITAALGSIGVGFVPRYTVLRELEQGSLIELFPHVDVLKDHINIYIKHRNASLSKFVCLIEHIKGFREWFGTSGALEEQEVSGRRGIHRGAEA